MTFISRYSAIWFVIFNSTHEKLEKASGLLGSHMSILILPPGPFVFSLFGKLLCFSILIIAIHLMLELIRWRKVKYLVITKKK